jgi:Lar family restriction alleviation protein
MTDSTDNARGPDLLPCPFCGGKAVYQDDTRVGFTNFSGLGNIQCDECRRSDGFVYKERDAAAKSWNTRANLAPDPLGAVKVRPLEWEPDFSGFRAFFMGVTYIIGFRDGSWFFMGKTHHTPEAAKATAQAHCETRILSALEPADVLDDARVKALVDAVTVAINRGVIWRNETEREFQMPIQAYERMAEALAAFDKGGKNE